MYIHAAPSLLFSAGQRLFIARGERGPGNEATYQLCSTQTIIIHVGVITGHF